MANEKQLLDLLRRAHTVIGEGLIENALDESAEDLHNDIAEVLGLPVTMRTATRCTATCFTAGGRLQRQCRENADPAQVCAICQTGRCEDHNDLEFYDHDGAVFCEDCAPEEAKNQ